MLRFPIWVPAIVAIGLWAAFQIIGGFGAPTEGGGVAYMAHIGGFVAGLVGGFFFRAIYREPRHPRGTQAALFR
jgi:membrane associated rhomboid family serine protease